MTTHELENAKLRRGRLSHELLSIDFIRTGVVKSATGLVGKEKAYWNKDGHCYMQGKRIDTYDLIPQEL